MDIEQIKKNKKDLENAISELISKFENENGVDVSDIEYTVQRARISNMSVKTVVIRDIELLINI